MLTSQQGTSESSTDKNSYQIRIKTLELWNPRKFKKRTQRALTLENLSNP